MCFRSFIQWNAQIERVNVKPGVKREGACRDVTARGCRLVTSGHHGLHAARVVAALRCSRAIPKQLRIVRFDRTNSAELKYQDGSSHTRHGVPGRLSESLLFSRSANALASLRARSEVFGSAVLFWCGIKIWLTEGPRIHLAGRVAQEPRRHRRRQLSGKLVLVHLETKLYQPRYQLLMIER